MKALIDGDILCYYIGCASDSEGVPLSWPLTYARLRGKIDQIVEDTQADEYAIYITGDGNFRLKEATIKPYKGHRTQPKPHHYENIKNFFKKTKEMEVVWCEGYEADDGMSMAQWEAWKKGHSRWNDYTEDDPVEYEMLGPYETEAASFLCETVICSLDKDLKIVPGNHFEWSRSVKGKEVPSKEYLISPTEGWQFFFKQLLTGDSTDNILGLFGVGSKSKHVIDINKMDDKQVMYNHCQRHYEDRFGSYWEMFMHENARLLWMLRTPEDDIRHDLMMLEGFRQLNLTDEY